ncbi:MAG: hypothetical protein CL666_08605 [Balneola sp.]|nr:hypothetical protein [Balneola sp.]|tara:strand:+ start:24230 stop:24637 length:408 start_codon:yes stop_codon:yes gene_type:complete
MDLSNLSVDPENQTAVLTVLHPTTHAPLTDEDGNEVTITIHGPDSKAQTELQRKFRNKALKDGVKRKNMSISSEQLEARALDMDVAATADWQNIGLDGKELECTPENVKMVYTKLPWIREQVEEFMADRANFMGK